MTVRNRSRNAGGERPAPAWYVAHCAEQQAARPRPAPRPGRAALPRIYYAEAAVTAYANALRYRKYRPYVLAGVVAWMLIRRLSR